MTKKNTRKDGLIERKYHGKHYYGHSGPEIDAKIRADIVAAAQLREDGQPFEDVANAYWLAAEPKLKYGSVRGYKKKVDTAIDWFGGRGIQTITASEISRKLDRMATQGFAYKSISGQKSVLSLIWRYWCSNMDGNANPVNLIKLPQGLPRTQRTPPAEADVELVKQHPEKFGLCANLMIYTGMRLDEVMALQRGDVDLAGKKIMVNRACTWHGNVPVPDTPKTSKAIRTIPLLDPLHEILAPRLKGLKPAQYIFEGTDGQMMTKSAYENAWLQYCKSLGLIEKTGKQVKTGKKDKSGRPLYREVEAPKFTAHQLRHEFASVLIEANVPEDVAKEILGHADIITTHRFYISVRQRQIDAAATAMNKFYSQS